MPLTNAQYDAIMRQYNDKQFRNQYIIEKRKENLYQQIPRLKEISDEIATLSVASLQSKLSQNKEQADIYKDKITLLMQEKEALLAAHQLDTHYLQPPYECMDCKDTGYINGEKCHCFKQAAINLVYAQSNIDTILKYENFDHFCFDYYSKTETLPKTNISSYDNAQKAYQEAKSFVDNFKTDGGNLFIYGDTGTGKTFLSNCVAKALLDQTYSVIYFTAFELFDIFAKNTFHQDQDVLDDYENIFSCDLLVIDDLGTELTNSFTTSQLFLCLNERLLRNKSTIISTNLSVRQIQELYSERTFSRISSNYKFIKLFGDDIRIIKKIKKTK